MHHVGSHMVETMSWLGIMVQHWSIATMATCHDDCWGMFDWGVDCFLPLMSLAIPNVLPEMHQEDKQQQRGTIEAAVVPAEIAALISSTVDNNMLKLPQYLIDAVHQLAGGRNQGCATQPMRVCMHVVLRTTHVCTIQCCVVSIPTSRG